MGFILKVQTGCQIFFCFDLDNLRAEETNHSEWKARTEKVVNNKLRHPRRVTSRHVASRRLRLCIFVLMG